MAMSILRYRQGNLAPWHGGTACGFTAMACRCIAYRTDVAHEWPSTRPPPPWALALFAASPLLPPQPCPDPLAKQLLRERPPILFSCPQNSCRRRASTSILPLSLASAILDLIRTRYRSSIGLGLLRPWKSRDLQAPSSLDGTLVSPLRAGHLLITRFLGMPLLARSYMV